MLNRVIANAFGLYGSKKKITKNSDQSDEILFSSARSAITATLTAIKKEGQSEVIVCAFTCDAVTHAVLAAKYKIIYVDVNDDLTMNELSIENAISEKTGAVIIQNTFGRLGVDSEFFEELKRKNIFILEDNCLSVGSKLHGNELGSFGDVSIWSLEVSKTVTMGWGGVLKINNQLYKERLVNYCGKLNQVCFMGDCRKLLQLWATIFLLQVRLPGSFILWYLLYGSKIFKSSSNENYMLHSGGVLMGPLSRRIYKSFKPYFSRIFRGANTIYKDLEKYIMELNVQLVMNQSPGEYIVSPRLSLLIDECNHEEVIKIANLKKIEIGNWFRHSPPEYHLAMCEINSSENAKRLSASIINLPSYWTISKTELIALKNFILILANTGILRKGDDN